MGVLACDVGRRDASRTSPGDGENPLIETKK